MISNHDRDVVLTFCTLTQPLAIVCCNLLNDIPKVKFIESILVDDRRFSTMYFSRIHGYFCVYCASDKCREMVADLLIELDIEWEYVD